MKKLIVIVSLTFVKIANLQAQKSGDEKLSLRGYLKSTIQASRFANDTVIDPLHDNKTYYLWQNTLHLRLFYEPNDFHSFETAYELSPVLSNSDVVASQGFFNPVSSTFRLKDFDPEINENDRGSDFFLFHNLDRLNLSLHFDEADMIIGRQAISFGSGKYINPTDIFSPFIFQDLNKEEKTGVDAIRVRVATGAMSELDAALVLGHNADRRNSAAFLRSKFYYKNTDISVMAIDFQDNLMLGLDVTRAIGDAGFWLECSHVFAGLFDERFSDEDYFRLTSGFDYNFGHNLYGFIEYHYNGAGTGKQEKYLSNQIRSSDQFTSDSVLQTAYSQGGVYLLGRHYLIPGAVYEFTPLLNGSIYMLTNLEDLSTYLGGRLEYSLNDDLFIEMGGFYGIGKEAERENGEMTPDSEFGLYSNLIYLGIRYYF